MGYFTTRAKSAGVSDRPRPSMMMPRAMGRNAVSKGLAVICLFHSRRGAHKGVARGAKIDSACV
ncbi:hypothetical protein D3C73_1556070 [compost metagenome]